MLRARATNTSQRITFVTGLAHTFNDPDEASYVLDSFGLPDSNRRPDWELFRYARDRLTVATDEQLLDLAAHQGYLQPTVASADADRVGWEDGKVRLFMSHTTTNKEIVSLVKQNLSLSCSCFVAHEDISPGLEWVSIIEAALATCDAACGFLTNDFHESQWTDQELGWLYGRAVPVILVSLDRTTPYGFVGKHQAMMIGTTSAPASIAHSVLEILLRDERTCTKAEEGAITMFCGSRSFDRTRDNYALLERIRHWTPDRIDKLRTAATTNSQIIDAVVSVGGVWTPAPDALEALFAQTV